MFPGKGWLAAGTTGDGMGTASSGLPDNREEVDVFNIESNILVDASRIVFPGREMSCNRTDEYPSGMRSEEAGSQLTLKIEPAVGNLTGKDLRIGEIFSLLGLRQSR